MKTIKRTTIRPQTWIVRHQPSQTDLQSLTNIHKEVEDLCADINLEYGAVSELRLPISSFPSSFPTDCSSAVSLLHFFVCQLFDKLHLFC